MLRSIGKRSGESVESNIDNILIIDNIDGAPEFATSRRILQEIHLYCPWVKIDFAYSLAKGGVAIHTSCQEDRDLLLAELPAESFGWGVKHLPKGYCDKTVFVKGVDTSVSVCQLTGHLLKYGISVIDIRRLTRRHTGKPIHIVKIKCTGTENSAKRLLSTRLVINNKVFRWKRKICESCAAMEPVATSCFWSSYCRHLQREMWCAEERDAIRRIYSTVYKFQVPGIFSFEWLTAKERDIWPSWNCNFHVWSN